MSTPAAGPPGDGRAGDSYLPPVLGEPQPLASGLDLPYVEGLLDHRIVLQRCGSCRAWQWAPEVICHRCHSFDMAWDELPSPTGSIFTWTRVWHPAREGLENAVPYLVVVVELPAADGVRLVGNLVGDPRLAVHAGEPVQPLFEDHDGYTLLLWQRV